MLLIVLPFFVFFLCLRLIEANFPDWFPDGEWHFEHQSSAGADVPSTSSYPGSRVHPCLVTFPRLPDEVSDVETPVSTVFLFGGTRSVNLTDENSAVISDLWSFRTGEFRPAPYVATGLSLPPARFGSYCFRKQKHQKGNPIFDFFVGGGVGTNVSLSADSPVTVLGDVYLYEGSHSSTNPTGNNTMTRIVSSTSGSLRRVFSSVWDLDFDSPVASRRTIAYVFGGLDESFLPTNDVYSYNTTSAGFALEPLPTSLGAVPSPRFGAVSWMTHLDASMVDDDGPWLWLFGGASSLSGGPSLQDLYLFRPMLNVSSPWSEWVSQSSWELGVEADDLSHGFPGRVFGCGSSIGVQVTVGEAEDIEFAGVLFGGVNEFDGGRAGAALSSLWWFNYYMWKWAGSAAPAVGQSEFGQGGSVSVPGSRFGCVMWRSDDSQSGLYVFGGYGNSSLGEGSHSLNELWRFEFEDAPVSFWNLVEYLQTNSVPFVGLVLMLTLVPVLIFLACCLSCCVTTCVDRRRLDKLMRAEDEQIMKVFTRTRDPEAAVKALESIDSAVVSLDAADANLSAKLGHYLHESGAAVVNIVAASSPSAEESAKTKKWSSSSGDLPSFEGEGQEGPKPDPTSPQDSDDPELVSALSSLRMMEYMPSFRENRVIFGDLPSLSLDEFKELVPHRIPRIRLQRLVKWEHDGAGSPLSPSSLRQPKWKLDESDVVIGDVINSGSFGMVRLGKFNVGVATIDVAVKEIAITARTKTTVESVMAEVRIMAKCRHPNVLQCFGCYFKGQVACVVMELCGGSLHEKKLTPLSRLNRLEYLIQTAEGMKYLHEQGVVHRDLKPGNILVHADGKVRICDFGTSKDRDEVSDTFCGTVDYMAPEMIGEIENVMLVDVYAYGILCWEIWTGDAPYAHIKTTQALRLFSMIHTGVRPLRPSLKHPGMVDCPDSMKTLMSECWLPSPEDRPQSFDEILEELEKVHEEVLSSDGTDGPAVARGPLPDSDSSDEDRMVMSDSSSDDVGPGDSVIHVPSPPVSAVGTDVDDESMPKPTFDGVDFPDVDSSSESSSDESD